MLSLPMLWAILLYGTATHAQNTPQPEAGLAQTEAVSSDDGYSGWQQALPYLAQVGTTAAPTYTFLQLACPVPKSPISWFASRKATPPYAARAPGDSFFCQFFYTSSQPQAP